MARTRTLVNLRAEVRDRADIENSLHITDAQITRYINQSCAALHGLLVDVCEEFFLEAAESAAPAPTNNITTIPAGTNFYKLAAFWVVVHGKRVHIERYTQANFPSLVDLTGPPYYYRVVSDTNENIIVVPALPTGATIGIARINAFADLSVDGDTFNGRDGWEEWVVLDAAIKCMVKEESDPAALMAERERCQTRILSQAKSRDLARPDRVRDAEPRFDDYDIPRAGRMV